MKFKTDENLPVEIAVALREAGHDAMTVVEQGLGGQADQNVAEVCRREERVLVTLDVDFANALLRTERIDQRLWIVDESRVRIRE